MRYLELLESTTLPRSFWINVKTRKIIPITEEHASYVFHNPTEFNLDKEAVRQIKDLGGGWSHKLMEIVTKFGWVRGGKDWSRGFKHSFYLQGYNNENLRKAAIILSEHTVFDFLAIDTFFETFSSSSFIRLYGDELEYWLKTGKFFKRNR